MITKPNKKSVNRKFQEKQTTRKGSKVDIASLDGEELKAKLEEKLGITLEWGDYSWEAKGDFSGIEVVLNFVESDKGNTYEIGYRKGGSIHDRSAWKGDSLEEFERDSDELLVELGDYSDAEAGDSEEDLDDDSSENVENTDSGDEGDFGEAEDEIDFSDFEESAKPRKMTIAERIAKRKRAAAIAEGVAEYKKSKLQEAAEVPGKVIQIAKDMKEALPNDETVGTVTFVNAGVYDLEKAGKEGYSVYTGYRHPGNGASIKRYLNNLTSYTYGTVAETFAKILTEKYGVKTFDGPVTASDVVIHDFTDTMDMYRLFVEAPVKAPITEDIFSKGRYGILVNGNAATTTYPKAGGEIVEFKSEKEAKNSDVYKKLAKRYGEDKLEVVKSKE